MHSDQSEQSQGDNWAQNVDGFNDGGDAVDADNVNADGVDADEDCDAGGTRGGARGG